MYGKLDADIAGSARFVGEEPYGSDEGGDQVVTAIDLDRGGKLTLQIATSFISVDQAKRNLEYETAGRLFDELVEANRAVREERLGRIVIEGATDPQKRVFYSCLYRTQLFPRIRHEPDETGNPIHYSPYDGQIHPGVMYADNGFWDTHRTVYSLLSILDRPRLRRAAGSRSCRAPATGCARSGPIWMRW